MTRAQSLAALAAGAVWMAGCGGGKPEAAKLVAPAKVETKRVKETDLVTVTLTAEAEKRLGIETAAVGEASAAGRLELAAEVVAPPGSSVMLTAPVAGTLRAAGAVPGAGARVAAGQELFRLLPLVGPQRDLRVTAEAETFSAKARHDAAKARAARAAQLLQDGVGSVRAREEAEQELGQAAAALTAAEARLRQVVAAPLDADVELKLPAPQSGVVKQVLAATGQIVGAGAALVEIQKLDTLWVRVPVFAGEARGVDAQTAARVRAIGSQREVAAAPVAAPPTGDLAAATVDRYFRLPAESGFQPGERVTAVVAARGGARAPAVPAAAVVLDIYGGAWVYVQSGEHAYERRRVEVLRVEGGRALLGRAPAHGAQVVTAGAAELFGTEFGAGK